MDGYIFAVAVGLSGAVWAGADTGLSRMSGAGQRRLYLPLIMRK